METFEDKVIAEFIQSKYYSEIKKQLFFECFFERKKQLKKSKYKVFQKERLLKEICLKKIDKLLEKPGYFSIFFYGHTIDGITRFSYYDKKINEFKETIKKAITANLIRYSRKQGVFNDIQDN